MLNDPNHAQDSIVFGINPSRSISGDVGLLVWLFGENYKLMGVSADIKTVTRSQFARRRVIGGPTSQVAGSSYQYRRFGTASKGLVKSGKHLSIVTDDGTYKLRYSGSLATAAYNIYNTTVRLSHIKRILSAKGVKVLPPSAG
jgi:hypothetical protein